MKAKSVVSRNGRRRKHHAKDEQQVVLGHQGRVVLPPSVTFFEVGQRVFISVLKGGIWITAKPKKQMHGRLLSCRVKQVVVVKRPRWRGTHLAECG